MRKRTFANHMAVHRVLDVVVSVALVAALVPTQALRAMAEEIPGDGANLVEEFMVYDTPAGPEVAQTTTTQEQAEPVSEPTVVEEPVVQDEAPAPEQVDDQAVEEAVPEASLQESTAEPVEEQQEQEEQPAETSEETIVAAPVTQQSSKAPAAAPSTTLSMSYGIHEDSVDIDGVYDEIKFVFMVNGTDIDGESYPQLELTYLDGNGAEQTTGFQLGPEGAVATWESVGGKTRGQAIVTVRAPGTYKKATLKNVVCSEGTVDVSCNLHDEVVGDKPTLTGIFLKDSSGNFIKNSSNENFDLTKDSTGNTAMDASAVLVKIKADLLDYTSDPATSKSYVIMYGLSGSEIARATFAPDTEGGSTDPRAYVAVLDHVGTSDPLPEGVAGFKVVAVSKLGKHLTSSEYPFVLCGATVENYDTSDESDDVYKADGSFAIDNSSPVVNIDYPHDKATTPYSPASGGQVFPAPSNVDFFAANPKVSVYIYDYSLDFAATTVWGVPLQQIISSPETAVAGATCSVINVTTETGANSIKVEATFTDGTYDAVNVAHAEDAIAGHAAVEKDLTDSSGNSLGLTHFVVDTEAPEVTAAVIDAEPADLGTNANGDPIVNGASNGDNRIYFFKTGESAGITLHVNEAHGIRSVEMSVPSNCPYTLPSLSGAVSSLNDQMLVSGHATAYELPVVEKILESDEFPDDVTFTITDFVGNQYTWSMSTTGTKKAGSPGQSSSQANADLLYDALGGTEMNHPTLLIEDDTAPLLTLTGPEDKSDAESTKPEYKRVFKGEQTVSLELVELNLKYLRNGMAASTELNPKGYVSDPLSGIDPNRKVVSVKYTTAVADGADNTSISTVSALTLASADTGTYTWQRAYTADGDYEVSAEFTDIVGHSTGVKTIEKFTIDSRPPTIQVDYANTDVHNGRYYQAVQPCTVKVNEHNFDPDLFNIEVTCTNAAASYTFPAYDPSAWTTDGDTHTYDLTFDTDGEYVVKVNGMDAAGNEAVLATDNTHVGYESHSFVVDLEDPEIASVEMSEPTGTYDGVSYYSHAVDFTSKIKDRNFNGETTSVAVEKDGSELAQAVSWTRTPDERDADGYETYEASLTVSEDGSYKSPHVTTTDLADRTSENSSDLKPFVIDLKAPTISVAVDRTPSAQGGSGDPYNFYNLATTMTFTVSDEHLLRSVKVDDPDGLYTVSESVSAAEGKGSTTVTVSLKDGAVGSYDGEYQRDIVLTAQDLAGNKRTWTIDRTGTVVLDESSQQAENVGINDGSEHPMALIQDTIAPVVGLSGPTAGTYYNSAQTAMATVNEFNFDYLKQFDGGRTIVTITTRAATPARTASTSTMPASAFAGSRPNYNATQTFSADGHYELSAQFADYAGNLSNLATIGEFTIDTTPPVISIEFDNNDVRNGKYYKAPRTATITVTEHNFDPNLIKIDTTGQIGGWSTSGDTHTATVYFGEGSAHTITVSGSDLAGNVANEVTEPEFVVDLTAPEVTIAGTAQRLGYLGDDPQAGLLNAYHDTLEDKSAYNGVVVPVITYTDNEALSVNDLGYAMSGSKHGDEVETESATADEGTTVTTTLRDLGYTGEGAGDGSNWDDFYVDDYAADADDIYTLKATMTDQAGNEAEAEIVFSVNRYGSNYEVQMTGLPEEELAEYEASGMLSEPPTIVVREVSVSGVAEDSDHQVRKEFANASTVIKQAEGEGAGYDLLTVDPKEAVNGWSEYIYTIRSSNFGEGSDSDNADRGQGVYRVNVMSDDASSNANTTAEYWGSDDARAEVDATGATAEFILDELGPAIDEVDIPTHLSAGESYEASFHVTDDITSGNVVEVQVDGRTLSATEVQGPANGTGTFSFTIPARPFDWTRDVKIVVRDYAGREASTGNDGWFWQSSFIPEGLVAIGVVGAVTIIAVAVRRRKLAAEPDLPI